MTSPAESIYYSARYKKYVARIFLRGRYHPVGRFSTRPEATEGIKIYKEIEFGPDDEEEFTHPDLLDTEFIPPLRRSGTDWGSMAEHPDIWNRKAKESRARILEAYKR